MENGLRLGWARGGGEILWDQEAASSIPSSPPEMKKTYENQAVNPFSLGIPAQGNEGKAGAPSKPGKMALGGGFERTV